MVSMPHLDVNKAGAGVSVLLLWKSEAILKLKEWFGLSRGLNPGPPAYQAGTLPLSHSLTACFPSVLPFIAGCW